MGISPSQLVDLMVVGDLSLSIVKTEVVGSQLHNNLFPLPGRSVDLEKQMIDWFQRLNENRFMPVQYHRTNTSFLDFYHV